MDPDIGTAEPETPAPTEVAEPEAAPAPEPTEPDFTDPAKLPPELQPLGQRLNASYTKRMQKIAEERRQYQADLELLTKFRSDPEFAKQVLQQEAQRLGLASVAPTPTHGASTAQVPPQLLAAIEANLAPELKWMAPQLAQAHLAGQSVMLGPLLQQQEREARSRSEQEYEALAEDLSAKAPGWEAHEDDMTDLLEFLQSKQMRSKKWGSKLDLLHKLVTGNASATTEAARRMGDAARSRTATGQSGRTSVPNIAERIAKAKTSRDAFQIAAEEALAEAERRGVRVR